MGPASLSGLLGTKRTGSSNVVSNREAKSLGKGILVLTWALRASIILANCDLVARSPTHSKTCPFISAKSPLKLDFGTGAPALPRFPSYPPRPPRFCLSLCPPPRPPVVAVAAGVELGAESGTTGVLMTNVSRFSPSPQIVAG